MFRSSGFNIADDTRGESAKQHSYLPVRRLFELRQIQRMQGTALSGTRPDDTPLHGLVASTGRSPIIASAFKEPMLPHQLAAIENRMPEPPKARLPGIRPPNPPQVRPLGRVNSYHEIPKESSHRRLTQLTPVHKNGQPFPPPEEQRKQVMKRNWGRASRLVQMSSALGSNISADRRQRKQMRKIENTANPSQCAATEPRSVSRHGVSLGFLRHVVQWSMALEYPRTTSGGREVQSFRDLTCEDIVSILVLPRTHSDQQQGSCSYTDLLLRKRQAYDSRPAAGTATVFVAYCRRYKFVDFVAALSDFSDKYLWIDMWSADQTELIDEPIDAEWLAAFEKTVKEIGHTVVMFDRWENATPLSRLWCLYELAITASTSNTFGVVLLPKGATDVSQTMPQRYKELVDSVQIDFNGANVEDHNERGLLIGALGAATLVDRKDEIQGMLWDWLADQGRNMLRGVPLELQATSVLAEQLVEHLQQLGRLSEAMPLMRQRLAGAKMKYGAKSKESLSCMQALGELHHLRWICKDGDNLQNELSLAVPLLSEALRGRRELFSSLDIQTLSTVDKIALVYHDIGDLDSALSHSEEAVEGFTKLLGADHPYLLTAKQNMGRILVDQGLLDKALPLHLDAYTGKQRVYGPRSPETIDSASALGVLYLKRKEHGSAAEMLREAFTGNRAVRGDSHASTIMDAKKLRGVLANETGVQDLELAELDRFVSSNTSSPDGVLQQLDAMTLGSRDRRGQGIELLESVYDDCRRSHGNKDPRTLQCLALIGWHHHIHGTNSNIAVNSLRQALVGLTNLVDENGVHHPLVPKVAKQLKTTLEKLAQQEIDEHREQFPLDASEMAILNDLCAPGSERVRKGRRRVWGAANAAVMLRSAPTM